MKRLFVIFLFTASLLATFSVQAQDDSLFTRRQEQPKKQFSWDRITFGGNFGLSFGNFTSINISPLIGYRITDKFTAGAGPSYIYSRVKYNNGIKYSTSVLGGRAFAQHIVFDNFAVRGEYEYLSIEYPIGFTASGDAIEERDQVSNPLLGASYNLPLGRRSVFSITVLYNFNYQNDLNQRFLYGNTPFVIRIGGMF